MAEYELDPAFEPRLARGLQDFAQEAVRPFDAVAIARMAAAGPVSTIPPARLAMPAWARPMLLAALLTVLLVAAGIAGGIIKLPSTDINPNPSFEPFSPPPLTPLPSDPSGSAAPPSHAPVTIVPGTQPPATQVPVTFVPGTPTIEPTDGSPTPGLETPTPSPTTTLEPTPSPSPSESPTSSPSAPPVALVIIDAASGSGHQCAVADDGRILCWGENSAGELGDGSTEDRFFPAEPVAGIGDGRQVAAGIRFSCALRAGGSVSCWGEGSSGQLGNGATAASANPVGVNGINDARQVVAGGTHACALLNDGRVMCWGMANRVGNGSATNDSSPVDQPVEVTGLTDALQIAAGWNHTCARRATGTISCWGLNGDGATGYGQLGDGTFDHASTPVDVSGIDDAFSIGAGGWSTCAIRVDRSVWCWGYGERGGLGNGDFANSNLPVRVTGIGSARRIAVGGWHACALAAQGVVCWGANNWGGSFGQLGNRSSEDSATPVEAPIDGPVTDVAAGWINSMAVGVDGQLWLWGSGGAAEPTPVSFTAVPQ